MLKFGIKAGVVGAAAYYLAEEGVWKDSEQSYKVYGKLNATLSPYAKQVEEQLPFKIPKLPSSNEIQFLTKHYWNKGVMSTFEFLANLPHTVDVWLKHGVNYIRDSEGIKSITGSSADKPEVLEKRIK